MNWKSIICKLLGVELGWAVIRISSNDEDETVEAKLSEIEIAYT